MSGQEPVRRYEAGEWASSQVELRGTDPSQADLCKAKLYEAVVTDGQLGQAESFEGAWLPGGQVYGVGHDDA